MKSENVLIFFIIFVLIFSCISIVKDVAAVVESESKKI